MQIDKNFEIFQYAEAHACPELHFFMDPETQLRAIVAIHSTALGPSLGGCRFLSYASTQDAVKDVILLAEGMTQKAAIADLNLGGGKAVLLRPKTLTDRGAYFRAFGRFVESLNGRYITAVDMGTSVEDMDYIEQSTKHVTTTSSGRFTLHDSAPMTAYGVSKGIEACLEFASGSKNLENKVILIQGLGHLGTALCQLLHRTGAKLVVYDIDPARVAYCVEHYQAHAAQSFEALINTPADVFVPCALGGVLTIELINQLQTKIIAGGANNQLQDVKLCGDLLLKRGMIYAPDFVINGGGLIHVAEQHFGATEQESKQAVAKIYNRILNILTLAQDSKRFSADVAIQLAADRVAAAHIKK